ncbi:HslU--HslV peptidase ATPase subunit, partial [Mycobacterium tuberculosis]
QDNETRIKFRRMLRNGELDEREIELEVSANVSMDIMTPPGMEEMGQQLRQMFSSMGGAKAQKRTLSIKAARPLLIEEEAGKLVNEDDIR